MGRPKLQLAKKSTLVQSAGKILALKGLAGTTLGQIAEDAGMSPNAALYYYPNLRKLLDDVQVQAMERFCTIRTETVQKTSDPVLRLAQLIEGGLPRSEEDDLCRLLYELGSHARIDASYASRYTLLFERQVALYMSVLDVGEALGRFKLIGASTEIARMLVVLEDGLGLHLINKTQSFDRASALHLLASSAAMATGINASELKKEFLQ